MNINRNIHILERLHKVYSAVLALSEQGFDVEAIDMTPPQPKLTITRDSKETVRRAGDVIGAKVCCGCEVLLVARGR